MKIKHKHTIELFDFVVPAHWTHPDPVNRKMSCCVFDTMLAHTNARNPSRFTLRSVGAASEQFNLINLSVKLECTIFSDGYK